MSKKVKTGIIAAIMLPMAALAGDKKPVTDTVQHKQVSPKDGHSSKKSDGSGKSKVSAKEGASGKGKSKSVSGKTAKKKEAVKVQYGIASYYSNKFEGRKTYTDEIFTQSKLTAASNTLPMGTWIRVTNLRNNRTVYCRVNDKMHPKNRRLVDLSSAAAKRLGYAGRGLTRVKIDVMGKKRPQEAIDEVADAAVVQKN